MTTKKETTLFAMNCGKWPPLNHRVQAHTSTYPLAFVALIRTFVHTQRTLLYTYFLYFIGV